MQLTRKPKQNGDHRERIDKARPLCLLRDKTVNVTSKQFKTVYVSLCAVNGSPLLVASLLVASSHKASTRKKATHPRRHEWDEVQKNSTCACQATGLAVCVKDGQSCLKRAQAAQAVQVDGPGEACEEAWRDASETAACAEALGVSFAGTPVIVLYL